MSHFTVLVIGQNPEAQLAPFHEFECTGENNEYVQNIDETDEYLASYESGSETKWKDAQGVMHNPYDPKFYREPAPGENVGHGTGVSGGIFFTSRDWEDGRGYRAKVHMEASEVDMEAIKVPYKELYTFTEWMTSENRTRVLPFGQQPDIEGEHKYGYCLTDEAGDIIQVIRRTNPNRKWDWYQLGGRWTGFLRLKPKENGAVGKPGIFGNQAKRGYCDQATKGQIDFAYMIEKAEVTAGELWDKMNAIWKDLPESKTWAEVRDIKLPGDIDNARAYFAAQPRIFAIEKYNRENKWPLGMMANIEDVFIPREEYVNRAGTNAIMTHAVIKDGQWHERGKMGSFAFVSNEKDADDWNTEFRGFIDSLPDDTLISLYDCHI